MTSIQIPVSPDSAGWQQDPSARRFWLKLGVAMVLVFVAVLAVGRVHRQPFDSTNLSQFDTPTIEHTFAARHQGEQEGTYVHAVGSCALDTTPGAVGYSVVDLEATQLPAGGTLPVTVSGDGKTATDVLRADKNGWTGGMWPATTPVTLTIIQGSEVAVMRITVPTECGRLHS